MSSKLSTAYMVFRNRGQGHEWSILSTIGRDKRSNYEVPPKMTMVRAPYDDINKLVTHLKALTDELTAVHGDLYWLAMQSQEISAEKPSLAELNVDLLAALKSAVDSMRLILWDYIETASAFDPQKGAEGMETLRLKRVTKFLDMLRKRLVRSPEPPLSFIERVSAAMKDRFRDKVA